MADSTNSNKTMSIYERALKNAKNEFCETHGMPEDSTLQHIVDRGFDFVELLDSDLLNFAPALAEAGFIRKYSHSLKFTDLVTISQTKPIYNKNMDKISVAKTMIWWLRELKRNGMVFFNDNSLPQVRKGDYAEHCHPFDAIIQSEYISISLVKAVARYCPIRNEDGNEGRLGKDFHPRFGNPRHNFLAYWLAHGLPMDAAFLKWGYTANDTNSGGMSILHIACELNNIPAIGFLLANGANINYAHPHTGMMALHYYAFNGTEDKILNNLISAENNVNHRDNLGQTPIFYAINNKNTWKHRDAKIPKSRINYIFTQMLLANGAELTVMNNAGFNPLDVYQEQIQQYKELSDILGVEYKKFNFSREAIYDEFGDLREGVTQEDANSYERVRAYSEELNRKVDEIEVAAEAPDTFSLDPVKIGWKQMWDELKEKSSETDVKFTGPSYISNVVISWFEKVFVSKWPKSIPFPTIVPAGGATEGGLMIILQNADEHDFQFIIDGKLENCIFRVFTLNQAGFKINEESEYEENVLDSYILAVVEGYISWLLKTNPNGTIPQDVIDFVDMMEKK